MTFFRTRLWKTYTSIMEKLWGIQFPEQPGKFSSMCNWLCHLTKSSKNCYHRDFIMVWQGLRTLAMYHTSSPVSILSSTLAQTHWITRRSTQKQQVGSARLSGNYENGITIPSSPMIFLDNYVFFFPFLRARCWKGPVVHPEDRKSFSHDGCRCSLQPRSANAGEGEFQAGQAENGEDLWHFMRQIDSN